MPDFSDDDVTRLRALALELRATADDLLRMLPGAPPESTQPDEPQWMRIADYANARGYAYRTMLELVGEGLPSVGEGRRRRIVVREADQWLRTKGARAPRREKSTDAA